MDTEQELKAIADDLIRGASAETVIAEVRANRDAVSRRDRATTVVTTQTRYTVEVQGLADWFEGDAYAITVTRCQDGQWAVLRSGRCLNSAGEWMINSVPENDAGRWWAEHRHDAETAHTLALAAAPHVTVGGMTAVDRALSLIAKE